MNSPFQKCAGMARRAQLCPAMAATEMAATGKSGTAVSAASVAHAFSAAGLFSSVLVLATAMEMEAFAPLLIALALYAAIFWVSVELLLWLWWFAQVVRSRRVVASASPIPTTAAVATLANLADGPDLSDARVVGEGRP